MVNADSKVGKLINGRYRILSALGTGASSHVYLAEDTQFGRMVALKMLVPDANSLQLNSRAFETEVAAITALSHEHNDHIVEIYDASLRTGEKYIVMEYVKGVTLREYMDDHRNMKLDDVYNCAEQILSALCLAHRVGIVHRDIKPQNVIVTEQGQLKVTDFGIAKLAKEDHFQLKNRTVGTVHYISPEQARGEETDARSDIYSLGVLLYELTTGRLPFDGQTVEVIAEKQITDNPVPPRQYRSNLPAGLEQVILCAMEKDQSDRFQSAEAMLAAISKVRKNPGVVFPGTPAEGEKPATAQPARINPLAGVTSLLKAPVEAFSDMLSKRNRKQRNILIAAVAGAGALVVALAAVLIVTLSGRDASRAYVPVPDYIDVGDMYEDDMYLRLGKDGLRLMNVTYVYNDAPAGMILDRFVPPTRTENGVELLGYGAPITLTVSGGPNPGPAFINVTQFSGYFPNAKASLEAYVRNAYGKCELTYEITSVIGARDAAGNLVKDGTILSWSNKDGTKTVTANSTVLVEVAAKDHEKLLTKSYVEILAELWTEYGVTAMEKRVSAPNGETGTARILITRNEANAVTRVVVETYN